MKRVVILTVVVLTIAPLSTYGLLELHDHHLSSDLRQTLTAAVDPTTTDSDLQVYLRDARLQVRTMKDREEFNKLEKATSAIHYYRALGNEHKLLDNEREKMSSIIEPYANTGAEVPPDIQKLHDDADKSYQLDLYTYSSLRAQALESTNDIRFDLGIPKIVTQ